MTIGNDLVVHLHKNASEVRKPNKRAYNRRCQTVDKKIAIRTNKDYLRQVNSLVRYCTNIV